MEFSGEEFAEFPTETIDMAVSDEHENARKGGRPTIGDNFLLGSRNYWRAFFEECWPEVGWALLQIRKRKSSTIVDVYRIFEPLKGKPHCDLANVFLRGSPRQITIQKLRQQKIASNKLRYALQDALNQRPDFQRSLGEAENALKLADEQDKPTIQAVIVRRTELLKQNEEAFASKERECIALEAEARDGETYIYCSELLDFLRSRRCALTPTNLANALAGLPNMRWRQSNVRCSKMREDGFQRNPYAVFQLIDRLFRRIGPQRDKSLADEFRAGLLKLPKKEAHPRDFICQWWRDLRLAIEEVSKARHNSGFIPYAITSAFLINLSHEKTSVDNILDAEEKLIPQQKKGPSFLNEVK